MNFKRRSTLTPLTLVVFMAAGNSLFAAERMTALRGHVMKELQGSTLMARTAPAEMIPISLVVQLDPDLMNQAFDEIYRRGAPGARRFLSSAQFAQKFNLSEKRRKLKQFARDQGFMIDPTEDRADSMVVKISGSAETVEKTFKVQLNTYRAPDGQVFRAHATEPMLPAGLLPDVSAVLGLSNLKGVARPHLRMGRKLSGVQASAAPSIRPRFAGTGPGASVSPSDIKKVYGLDSTALTGAGQTVALFELDGYDPADIDAYETQFGLPHVPLTFIGIDGTTNLCGGISCALQDPTIDTDMVEVALDIEMILALASGVTQVLVYDGPNTFSGVIHQYDRIATDNLASIVSTSWGLYELAAGSAYGNAEAPIFQRMALQGQAMFAASGDFGAYDNGSTLSVDDPASQPYVTAVGGTTLTGTPGVFTEITWDGSGGGVSQVRALPSYQSGVPGTASTVFRNVPDVALNADPVSGYAVRVGGSWFAVGGTSAAAPLWAAFMALVNQQRAVDGNGAMGFANPTLYSIGVSTSYPTLFHDITVGDNQFYSAATGYDNATGFGSFRGAALIGSLGTTVVASLAPPVLGDVYAYPNPWDVRKHAARQITFANTPGGAQLKIFTVSGFLVKDIPVPSGGAVWDLTNTSGQEVASGLYIYLITLNGDKVVGKVAVIR